MKEKFILFTATIISLFVVSSSHAFDFDSLMRESTGKEKPAEKTVKTSRKAGGLNFDSLMRGAAGEERGSGKSADISLDGVEAGRHRMRVGKAAKRLAPKNMAMKRACSCVLTGKSCTEIPSFDDMDAAERLMLKEEKNEEVKMAACIEWSENISRNPPGGLDGINSAIVFIDRSLASFKEMDSDVAQQVASLEREQRNELRRQRRQRERREERARREAEEEEEERAEREEERRIANQPAQVSGWASTIMGALDKAGDDLLRQQRENNERILAATKQAYKEKNRRQEEEREAREKIARQQKERQRDANDRRHAQLKREKRERMERKRKKAREKRELRYKCEQKGGKFHDRTGNCTIIKTANTVVLTDLGTNRVYGDEVGSVNSRRGGGSSSRVTSQSNGASNNTSNSGASGKQKTVQEKTLIDVAEVRMMCWVKDKEKGGQNWKCSGPVQTAVLNSPTEEEAMKYMGCENPRKKFSNVRFTQKSGKSIKYDRAFVYACDRPFESYEKRIEDRYNIQYPASVIFKKYQCDTDVFLGHWSKYCK